MTGPEIFTSRMIGAAGISNLCDDNSSAAFISAYHASLVHAGRQSHRAYRFSSRFPDILFCRRGSSLSDRSRRVHFFMRSRPSSSLGGGGGSITAGSIKTPASAGGCSSITSSSPNFFRPGLLLRQLLLGSYSSWIPQLLGLHVTLLPDLTLLLSFCGQIAVYVSTFLSNLYIYCARSTFYRRCRFASQCYLGRPLPLPSPDLNEYEPKVSVSLRR